MKLQAKNIIILSITFFFFIVVTAIPIFTMQSFISPIAHELPYHIKDINKTVFLGNHANYIRYYDEVLTQSARNYAFTGGKKWKERYNNVEPELDRIIKEATAEGDETETVFFSSIDAENIALVAMEEKAIGLVDEQKNEEAIKILESEEYWTHKERYKNNLEKYIENRGASYDDIFLVHVREINSLAKEINNVTNQFIFIEIVLGFSFVFILIFFTVFLTKKIISPLEKLTKKAEEVQKGKKKISIGKDLKNSKDEVGALAIAFEKMAKDIYEKNEQNKKAEEELKKSVNALKKSETAAYNLVEDLNESLERLKEIDIMKSQFLSITSHELKTPITPIRGQVQLITDGLLGDLNDKQKNSMNVIRRNVFHLQDLIDDILDISKLQANKMKFIFGKESVTSIVQEAIENQQDFAKKNSITLESDVKKHKKSVLDKNRIRQLVTNLINNAIKFSETGKKVVVSTKEEGNSIIISIKDSGVGINPDDKERLFKPFSQIDSSQRRRYEGTGLGLAICKGIAKEHKGRVWFESKGLGKGTTFFVKLPFKESKKDA